MQSLASSNEPELMSAHQQLPEKTVNHTTTATKKNAVVVVDDDDQKSTYAPYDEERMDVQMGQKFDNFMTYVCFPDEQLDYICFPERAFGLLDHEERKQEDHDDDDGIVEREEEEQVRTYIGIAQKEKKKEVLGISIRQHIEEEEIYLSRIQPFSQFTKSELEPGMRIISINDKECPKTISAAIKLLRGSVGIVKIEAERLTPKNEKDDDDDDDDDNDSPVMMTNKNRDDDAPRDASPSSSSTEPTQNVHFTDIFCGIPDSVTNACGQYEDAITTNVDIVLDTVRGVDDDNANKMVEQTIQIYKKTKSEKLGIALMQAKNSNTIYVNHVWQESKFAAAGLQAGLKVLRINGTACPQSLEGAVATMKKTTGPLKLTVIPDDEFCHDLEETLLWNGTPIANKLVVRIQKTKGEPLGLLLKKFPNRNGIFVNQIGKDSKAATTKLKPHMKILLINGQACPQEMEACTRMISDIEGELKIVAVAYIPEELVAPVDV
eukprot:scaffold5970_cov130-Cylindrotheca_fusiformis.AAC.4